MEDFNPSMYDDDDDLVKNILFWQFSDQSVIERMASLSDIPPVLKNHVAVAGSNSRGAGLHMDMPPPLDRSLAANYCNFQTSDPISFSNHDVCEDNTILSTFDYVRPTGCEDLLESDNAILPTGSEDLFESDNAIVPTLDYVEMMRSEELLEWENYAISMIMSSERTQDKEAKNGIDENQLRNNASLVLSDHSKVAEDVAAVVAIPPLRQVSTTIAKNSPQDGHNWRKYGQKHVKNSKFPRSYYRCTHPICKVMKKIEYSPEGHVTEIIYKGSHNHPKVNPSCDHVSNYLMKQMTINGYSSNKRSQDQYIDNVKISSSARSACQPKYTITMESDHEVFDDGFRWRKYGQKVVKGNSNPRSYYKCTHPKCIVRKHIERAPNDIKLVLTTYEGRHKHEIPATRNNMNTNLNFVAIPSLNLGGPRVSLNHHNQANNMVLEARVEAPTMTNQERFTGFECPNHLNMVPPGTISAELSASANISFGSTIMPFAGLHGSQLSSRVGNGHNVKGRMHSRVWCFDGTIAFTS